MKAVRRSGQFRKDLRLADRRGCDLTKLERILDLLIAGRPLPAANRDHQLNGRDWRGCRECHIEPDWLLVYRNSEHEYAPAHIPTYSGNKACPLAKSRDLPT